MKRHPFVYAAIKAMKEVVPKRGKMFMPGDGRYQPKELCPFLGYDNWAAWLIIVEWMWMVTLAKMGVMPKKDARLLTEKRLIRLIKNITTTMQDYVESEAPNKTNHDILALLILMRKYLPKALHKWLHLCGTSYDILCTAYALQIAITFETAFVPMIREVDKHWLGRIEEHIGTLQAGRTHLQTALPVMVGLWLAQLHSRFLDAAREALVRSQMVPGKFSGAVGTFASQRVLLKSREAEAVLMELLGLPKARISTQITPPEATARFYSELVLMSGATANIGEDVRILQASQFGELMTDSSSSSAMPHKTANPIAAENDAGMHVSVISENMKVQMTLVSDLQRDLRWSNVMRSFSAVMVYCFQQLKTTLRILKSMKVNKEKCWDNFNVAGKLVVAELLHLSLQKNDWPDSHHFVNKMVVPAAARSGRNLLEEAESFIKPHPMMPKDRWQAVKDEVGYYLEHPEEYVGYAEEIAREELENTFEMAV